MAPSKETLRNRAVEFCQSFVDALPPDSTLSQHFSSNPKITEHGKTFSGRKGDSSSAGDQTCDDYFTILSKTLKFEPSPATFPPPESFIVDETCEINGKKGVVSVVANGTFRSIDTGKGWDETFIYRLSEFDDEGKIGHWEIWADTYSAWEAVHA
ncbi:transcription elongation factor s-ii protein [Rutstroemia sp. NJR-2017a BBW]|nr:transcription elongation factor s-ii protein [Rutstroemia sp. NJR-2017a BBW]